MQRYTRLFSVILIGVLAMSCTDKVGGQSASQLKIIAKAGEEELELQEFSRKFVSTGVINDSLYNARKYIESWAIESLFYQEANEKLEKEEILIEQEVEDFRRSLVNHIYQTRIVEANLDTLISDEEIAQYYDEHRDNFILKDNIVKVNYVKVPLLAPGLQKIKKLIHSRDEKDKAQLNELCAQNAENFFMNDSTWIFLDEIKKEIPSLKEQPDLMLSPGRMIEIEDEAYYYYLKINDIKVKNGLSPLNFERQNIRKFILNNRKTQLVKQYKQMLLEKAASEKKFVIF